MKRNVSIIKMPEAGPSGWYWNYRKSRAVEILREASFEIRNSQVNYTYQTVLVILLTVIFPGGFSVEKIRKKLDNNRF